MQTTIQNTLKKATACELRFDDHSRQLYATDASIYQIVPQGVAFPRSIEEVSTLLPALIQEGIPVRPVALGRAWRAGPLGMASSSIWRATIRPLRI